MFISNNNKFLYVRIPKTASSSLTQWFKNNFNDVYRAPILKLHPSIEDAVDVLDVSSMLPTYNVISVIRDPLDRLLSTYFFFNYKNGLGENNSPTHFRNLIQSGYIEFLSDRFTKKQVDFIKYNNTIVSSPWLFENLDTHISEFCEQYNILPTPLPKLKSNYRPLFYSSVDFYYDQYTKDAVLDYYKEDYELYMNVKETA